MKKNLILLGLVSAIIISCKCGNNTNGSNGTDSAAMSAQLKVGTDSAGMSAQLKNGGSLVGDTAITLNGIDSAGAKHMQMNFATYKKQDKGPIKENVWFDIATIKNIVSLLHDERAAQPQLTSCTKGYIDGIRIYFISDTTVKKGQLKNSIMLVSTKDFSLDPKVESGAIHQDYYMHSKNAALFKENRQTLIGLTKEKQLLDDLGVDNLNSILNLLTRIFPGTNDCNSTHFITRGMANKMVNQFGKDTIRTTSEWFDLDLFEKIAVLPKVDGLRIYFARHPEKYRTKKDSDYPKEAFVLVPTNQKIINHKIYHRDNYTCIPLDSTACKPFRTMNVAGGGDDKGEMCPENCDADSLNGGANAKKQAQAHAKVTKKVGK